MKAIQATSRFPNQHGTPIQVGNSEEIGISDPYNPDFGDPWIPENEKDFIPIIGLLISIVIFGRILLYLWNLGLNQYESASS